MNGVPMRRSPDIERYTISSNGRLGRLLLDAELSPDSASKAEKDQVGDTALCRSSQAAGEVLAYTLWAVALTTGWTTYRPIKNQAPLLYAFVQALPCGYTSNDCAIGGISG